MAYPTSRTFGLPDRVSCGKFRIIGFRRFCLLCLMFGLFMVGRLPAQGPEGEPPSEGDRGGGRRDRGGRGGFDPAQMIASLDKDGNGVITASEIDQLPGPFRDQFQQSGLDFNKGVRLEDMQQNIQRRMEERRSGGGEDRVRDRGRDFERSDRPEIPPPQDTGPGDGRDGRGNNRVNGSPGGSPAPAPSSVPGNSSNSKKGRTRISPLLPDAYKALDTDFDGQIALYEWRNGKRGTISQFVQNDFDGDGFLIAKELAKAVATTPAGSGAAPTSTSVTVSAPPKTPTAPAAPVEVTAAAAAKALGAFGLLDGDKNGIVVGPEWDKSARLKPMFEKGGVDLSQPLNQDAFTQAYVRVGADK